MKIDIQAIDFTASEHLIEQINQKINNLQKRFSKITGADVYMKITSDHPDKLLEMRIFLPGEDLFAGAQGESFLEALNDVNDKLQRQLERYKENF